MNKKQQRKSNRGICWFCGESKESSYVRKHSRNICTTGQDTFNLRVSDVLIKMAKDEITLNKITRLSSHDMRRKVISFYDNYGNVRKDDEERKYSAYMIGFRQKLHAKEAFYDRINNMENEVKLKLHWNTAQWKLQREVTRSNKIRLISKIFYTGYTDNPKRRRKEHCQETFSGVFSQYVLPKSGGFLYPMRDDFQKYGYDKLPDMDKLGKPNLVFYTLLGDLTEQEALLVELLTLIVLNEIVMFSSSTSKKSVYSMTRIGENNEENFWISGLRLGAELVLYGLNGKPEYFTPWKYAKDISNRRKRNNMKNVFLPVISQLCLKSRDYSQLGLYEQEQYKEEELNELSEIFESFLSLCTKIHSDS